MSDKNNVINNPDPLIIKIADLDGKVHELTARIISPNVLKDYNEYFGGQKLLEYPQEEQLPMQMAWVYGGDKEDYFNFDIRVLRKAITLFAEAIENPI